MKNKIFILGLILFPFTLNAQFERKVSINVSTGIFKSFGEKYGYRDDGEPRPKQMPSYKPGTVTDFGFQFNISPKFSLLTEFGIMYSGAWSLISDDEYNWMHYENWNHTGDTLLSEGFNESDLFNFSVSVKPKFYFLPGKKFNPFLYAGFNINFTHANYTDNLWRDYVTYGLMLPGETPPDSPFLEKNIGFGLSPGLGVEYNPGDKLGVFLTSGYYLIIMNKKNFWYGEPERAGNLNAFLLQAGIRYSFFKSKNL